MRAWVLIALLGAGLSGLAIATFAGFLDSDDADQVRFDEILGAPVASTDQTVPPTTSLGLAFTADGKNILSRQADGRVMAWGRSSGEALLLAQTNGAFAYCPAERRLVISNDAAIVSLALEDGQFEPIAEGKHDFAAFSGDCSTLAVAVATEPEILLIRGTEPPQPLVTRQPVRNGLSLSPDGSSLAAALGSPEGTQPPITGVEIFDLDTPEPQGRFISDDDTVLGRWSMQFEPSGRGLFLGSQSLGQGGLRRIDVVSGELAWGSDGAGADWVRGLAAGPNGIYLASGDDAGRLRLWDAETGVMLSEHKLDQPVQSMAFSPDGGQIAVALSDGTIGIVPLGALF